MKKVIYFFLFSLLISCTSARFITCDNSEKGQYNLLPLKEGNQWEYMEYEWDGNIAEDSTEKVFEIGPTRKVYFIDENGNKNFTDAYQIIVNGEFLKQSFYLDCGNEVIFADSYELEDDHIHRGRTIPSDIENFKKDLRSDLVKWHEPAMVKVAAGEFKCWCVEIEESGYNANIIKEYYADNVGIVKIEFYNYKKQLQYSFELKKYKLN